MTVSGGSAAGPRPPRSLVWLGVTTALTEPQTAVTRLIRVQLSGMPPATRPSSTRRARRVVSVLVAVVILTLGLGIWWANTQGFIAVTGADCTAEGYRPLPSYDELVNDYGKSPYCARDAHGDTWF
jgi:hypothetical protein